MNIKDIVIGKIYAELNTSIIVQITNISFDAIYFKMYQRVNETYHKVRNSHISHWRFTTEYKYIPDIMVKLKYSISEKTIGWLNIT